jgi:hypothetical protein
MSRAAVSVAVTAPSRPNFGGPHVRAYADGTRCAEGSRRRSISYAKGVATPTVLLAGWPGHPIRRRSRLLAVGVSSHSYSETLTRSSTMHVSAHLYALVKEADCLCTCSYNSTVETTEMNAPKDQGGLANLPATFLKSLDTCYIV